MSEQETVKQGNGSHRKADCMSVWLLHKLHMGFIFSRCDVLKPTLKVVHFLPSQEAAQVLRSVARRALLPLCPRALLFPRILVH